MTSFHILCLIQLANPGKELLQVSCGFYRIKILFCIMPLKSNISDMSASLTVLTTERGFCLSFDFFYGRESVISYHFSHLFEINTKNVYINLLIYIVDTLS